MISSLCPPPPLVRFVSSSFPSWSPYPVHMEGTPSIIYNLVIVGNMPQSKLLSTPPALVICDMLMRASFLAIFPSFPPTFSFLSISFPFFRFWLFPFHSFILVPLTPTHFILGHDYRQVEDISLWEGHLCSTSPWFGPPLLFVVNIRCMLTYAEG